MKMKLKKIYEEVLGETEKLGFLAYHGSPTDFKKFSDEFVGGDEATDQEGPGVYFTTNRENAAAYGGNLYTAKLNGNFITDESASANANEAHIEQLIRMAEDWQSHAQNWGEDPESAIYSSISDMFEYNDNEKDVFLQVWIEYYRYDAVNFVRNMTKLGYDGVVVDRTDDRGINKHIIVYNPSTITLTDKEVISEELTYRHANSEGPEDDEYEIGMVKENKYSEILKQNVKVLKSLPNEMTLYRVVFLKDKNSLNQNNLGSHYVLNKKDLDGSHYTDPHMNADGNPFILTVKADKNEIDYEATLKHNMQYPNEKELTLKNKGAGAKLVNIIPFQSKSFDLNTSDDLNYADFDDFD
jgi:hypothetical protein